MMNGIGGSASGTPRAAWLLFLAVALAVVALASVVSPVCAYALDEKGAFGPAGSSDVAASGRWGTCPWELGYDGVLHLHGGWAQDVSGVSEWDEWRDSIEKVVLEGPVTAPYDSSYLFAGLENVTSIEGLELLDTSDVMGMQSMFEDCLSLTSLELPATFDTSKVVDMEYLFLNCESLTTLQLPESFDTSSVKSMVGMFSGCVSLASLELPAAFDTSKVENMQYMFSACEQLASLTLPDSFVATSARTLRAMFGGCTSLASLTFPDAFATTTVTSMTDMFGDCSSLKELTLPAAFDTSNVRSAARMFEGANSLLRIELKGTGFTLEGAFPAPGVLMGDGSHTGRWRAVGPGTDAHPLGNGYREIPPRTAGVFVPELAYRFLTCARADGTILHVQEVSHGYAAERPADPEKEGYSFRGWLLPDGSVYDWTAPVVSDLTAYAAFEQLPTPPAPVPKPTPPLPTPVPEPLPPTPQPLPAKAVPAEGAFPPAVLVPTGDPLAPGALAFASSAVSAALFAAAARRRGAAWSSRSVKMR